MTLHRGLWLVPLACLLLACAGAVAQSTEPGCPPGTTPASWTESIYSISGIVSGCVDAAGDRVGAVTALDEKGDPAIKGSYEGGRRHGVWVVRMFPAKSDPYEAGEIRLWYDMGRDRSIEGGPLSEAFEAAESPGAGDSADGGVRAPDVPFDTILIEKLASSWCEVCPAYSAKIARDGELQFVGYGGPVPLGPHVGRVLRERSEMLFRVAERMDLAAMSDNYRVPARPAARLFVQVQSGDESRLISVYGQPKPAELFDLARILELLLPDARWEGATP